MTKTNTCISLNTELKKKAQQYGINLSEFMEKNLENFLNFKENNPNSANLSVFRTELAQNEKKFIEIQAKITNLRQQIRIIEDEIDKKTIEEQQKEAERRAKAQKCLLCGFVVAPESKSIDFSNGKVHQSCYLEANAQQIKQLTRGGTNEVASIGK